MSENWGSDAAIKLRKEVQRKNQEAAVLLEHGKLRQEQAPHLWQEVRQAVKAMCSSLNAEYGEEVAIFQPGQARELNVRLRNPAGGVHELKATFEPSSSPSALTWNTSGHESNVAQSGKYALSIENGKVVFGGTTPDAIAKKMLDSLLLP